MSTQNGTGPLMQKENCAGVSPSKEMRKIRVELSDKIFELKKMEEDYAESKAHMMIQHNQEKVALNATIQELRTKMAEQNQHWSQKVDEIRKDNEANIAATNIFWEKKISTEVNERTISMQNKYDEEILSLRNLIAKQQAALKQNEKRFEAKLYQSEQLYKKQINTIINQAQREQADLKKKFQIEEEMKISAIMHIKLSEEKQHAVTKNLLKIMTETCESEKKKYDCKVFELNQQIWAMKKQIEELAESKKKGELKIMELQQGKQSALQMTNLEYEEKINAIEKDWRANMESLNEKWKCEYKKIQVAFEKSQALFSEREKLWQERGNKVLRLYEKREAREEDMKLIEQLEVQLIRKQFQLERQKQELKTAKLELDNMDDLYKRFFHSTSKHRNSASFHLKKVRLPGIVNRSTHPVKLSLDN